MTAKRTGKVASRMRRVTKVQALVNRGATVGKVEAATAALERVQADSSASDNSAVTLPKTMLPVVTAPREPLSDAIIRRLPIPKTGSTIHWDTALRGFGVRVNAGGGKIFFFNYRTRTGRERRPTLGAFPNWSTGSARIEARRLRHLVDQGGDPLADREAERDAPTVAELIDRFEQEHLSKKRASTADDYRRMLHDHIKPAMGRLKVSEVTFEDVDRLHRRITTAGHSYRANRVVAVLSKMFTLSVRWRMREDNPCEGIEKNKEYHRRRYLNSDELAALLKALASHPEKQTADAIRLLLLTGARRGEVLSMRWADIDFIKNIWSKPAYSTKQKEPHEVPLSAPVRQLLEELRAQQTDKRQALPTFVFSGSGKKGHIVEIKRGWGRLCKNAGIRNLRIHDLRHSFASALVSDGASLPLIGALLGHSNPSTTARYAHLFQDPQRKAVERLGAVIEAAGQPAPAQAAAPRRRRT